MTEFGLMIFLTFMITCTLDFESGGSDTGIACVPFYL